MGGTLKSRCRDTDEPEEVDTRECVTLVGPLPADDALLVEACSLYLWPSEKVSLLRDPAGEYDGGASGAEGNEASSMVNGADLVLG